MNITSESTDQEVAAELMRHILYDNGLVNRLEPEHLSPAWLHRIELSVGDFLESNPQHLNSEALELIATGEVGECEATFEDCLGFKQLSKTLDEYFESGGKDKEQP